MSLSRAEVEAMDRDELVDTLVNLSDTVEDLEMRLEALSRWKDATRDRLDRLEDENDQLRAENDTLRERLDAIEATAEQAMTVASAGHDPDGRSKTEAAKHVTRNTLVVRVVGDGGAADRALTVDDVRRKLEGEVDNLPWQIVRNAWDQLQDEWPQFYDTTTDGQQAVDIRGSDVTKALVRAVEQDLGRDDLAKRFVGENGGSGS
jgi:regulator of replication initiation timing